MFFFLSLVFFHNLLPISFLQDMKGVVRKKIWKSILEVEREAACETGVKRLF